MYLELFVEFLGTFLLLSVILQWGKAIPIGVAFGSSSLFRRSHQWCSCQSCRVASFMA